MHKHKINGLIISAGFSSRMKAFKPLADYKGLSFIISIISKFDVICDQIFVVTGYKADELKSSVQNDLTKTHQAELLKKINFVYNESFEKGMFTSLQKGISYAQNCDWILYHFVDQPGLPNEFYTNFTNKINNNYNWIQPSFKNENGHPILISKDLFELIVNSPSDTNLREISKNQIIKKRFWECDYKEIFQDIDTDIDLKNI